MLEQGTPLAIYARDRFDGPSAKMAYGVLRYSPNPVVAVVDPSLAGRDAAEFGPRRPAPIVATVDEAARRGARALVLGIAPLGGRIPEEWRADLDEAVRRGLLIVNGLHERLAPRYGAARVWDVRTEPPGLEPATGAAGELNNRRLLMVGSDMAVGKMTAGLEVWRALGADAGFVATGQIGITVTGAGVPLDAVRLDFAAGAIEREVMRHADREWIVVEGQGAVNHPASSATLPLLRGSMPTHLVLCHRAGQTHLRHDAELAIPPLPRLIALYEALAAGGGAFGRPKTVAVALNTGHLDSTEAQGWCERVEAETGLPTADPIRHGPGRIVEALTG